MKRLILSRGYLRDRAIRPSLKAFKGDEALFKLLGAGLLVVAESEFCQWKTSAVRRLITAPDQLFANLQLRHAVDAKCAGKLKQEYHDVIR